MQLGHVVVKCNDQILDSNRIEMKNSESKEAMDLPSDKKAGEQESVQDCYAETCSSVILPNKSGPISTGQRSAKELRFLTTFLSSEESKGSATSNNSAILDKTNMTRNLGNTSQPDVTPFVFVQQVAHIQTVPGQGKRQIRTSLKTLTKQVRREQASFETALRAEKGKNVQLKRELGQAELGLRMELRRRKELQEVVSRLNLSTKHWDGEVHSLVASAKAIVAKKKGLTHKIEQEWASLAEERETTATKYQNAHRTYLQTRMKRTQDRDKLNAHLDFIQAMRKEIQHNHMQNAKRRDVSQLKSHKVA
jgi:hypothetical protein